jgi:hypothetical protein
MPTTHLTRRWRGEVGVRFGSGCSMGKAGMSKIASAETAP